jgi:hypothetical protein
MRFLDYVLGRNKPFQITRNLAAQVSDQSSAALGEQHSERGLVALGDATQ